MANDLNQCNFIGRLGRDLESLTFPNGDMVANGTLAVGSTWKDKNSGERKESTEWVRLVFSGKLAEIALEYLRKGSQIFISGEMRTRKWTDQSGQEKYSTEIRVNQMQMLGGKSDGNAAPEPSQRRAAPAPRQASAQGKGTGWSEEEFDSQIPF